MVLKIEALRIEKGGFGLTADIEVSPGDLVAVIGPSGAGKSTLFDAISGFLTPKSGWVSWCGAALDGLAPGKRPVAMLFQDNNLFPYLNVGQNVALALTQSRRLTGKQRARVDEVLVRVGLNGFFDRKISQLSGGQISRVSLARLLLQDRPLWLLDEPFAALGPGLKQEMLALVAEVAREAGVTVLMITHDPTDAQRFADRCLLVAGGRAEGPYETHSLFADPPDELKAYLGL